LDFNTESALSDRGQMSEIGDQKSEIRKS